MAPAKMKRFLSRCNRVQVLNGGKRLHSVLNLLLAVLMSRAEVFGTGNSS